MGIFFLSLLLKSSSKQERRKLFSLELQCRLVDLKLGAYLALGLLFLMVPSKLKPLSDA